MKKKIIMALAVFFTANSLIAQICVTENFTENTTGWSFSQGARVGDFNNPLSNCSDNRGIITPGVGGNNPCNIKTPTYSSSGATEVQLTFDILCFDANLKCNTWKDFDCTTSVDVFYFVGATKHVGITDFILPANGPSGTTTVNLVMPVGGNLPVGTPYQIQLEFKFKSGTGNCVQQNTKYVFDNFRKCENAGNTFTSGPVKTGVMESDFTITPNRSSEFKINTAANYDHIQLLDNSGKVVRTFNNKSGIFSTNGLVKGTYLVRLSKNDWIISLTKKLVIN